MPHRIIPWLARIVVDHWAPRLRRAWAALGLILGAGFVVALLAVLGFALLGRRVLAGETRRFDEAVLRWMNAQGSSALDRVAVEVTALGESLVVWVVGLAAAALFWAQRERASALVLLGAIAGGSVLSPLLKSLYDRPRPQVFVWKVEHAAWSSFPSGHALLAMVGYATLAYLIVELEISAALRRLVVGGAALVVVLVGLSRMYLGVHYPTDVLAGYAAGFVWAYSCAACAAIVRGRGERGQKEEDDGQKAEGKVQRAEGGDRG
jgi:undecaprenyl-diphosphatase